MHNYGGYGQYQQQQYYQQQQQQQQHQMMGRGPPVPSSSHHHQQQQAQQSWGGHQQGYGMMQQQGMGGGGYGAYGMGGMQSQMGAYAQPGMSGHPPGGGMQGRPGMPSQMQQHQQSQQQQQQAPAPRASRGGPPKREMDSLLEELKAKQRLEQEKKESMKNDPQGQDMGGLEASRSQDLSRGMSSRSLTSSSQFGASPPSSSLRSGVRAAPAKAADSNGAGRSTMLEFPPLFISELPSSATEDVLCPLFSRYGVVTGLDIIQVKEKGQKITGYVTMDTVENAQRAKEALQGRDVDGVLLMIEWAKSPPPVQMNEDFQRAAKNGCRHVCVEPPIDKKRRRIIDRLAKYVAQDGHPFEQAVMDRESPDGTFGFLFKPESVENVYYRWRTWAFAQGDNFKVWRTETFRMAEGGAWWRPPPCEAAAERQARSTNFSSGFKPPPPAAGPTPGSGPAASSTAPGGNAAAPAAPARPQGPGVLKSTSKDDVAEEERRIKLEEKAILERQRRDRDRKGLAGGRRLSDTEWDQLERLLRSITMSRSSVLEAMVFCMDHCDSAVEIAECIAESLTILETEWPLKMARLMLVSDVLHNTTCSRQSAWAFRREFERSLPDIFEHLHLCITRDESKLQADRAKQQMQKLIQLWEEWGLFAGQYLKGLEAALLVGTKRLRLLAQKGDTSREPAWLVSKLTDWRRQHFSQLEKLCRTKGLRCSTGHLEATRGISLEEARKDWLIDRLVTYELLMHEKDQARMAVTGSHRRSSREDLDGEAIECDLDGTPLDEAELEGIYLDFRDSQAVMALMEVARLTPDAGPGGSYLGSGPVSAKSNTLAPPPTLGSGLSVLKNGGALLAEKEAQAADEVVGVVLKASKEAAQPPKKETPPTTAPAAERPAAAAKSDSKKDRRKDESESSDDDESDEVVDVKKKSSKDEARMAAAAAAAAGRKAAAPPSSPKKETPNIELEVMELRASLLSQGLHRDAIEDILDEKRQTMEAEAKKEKEKEKVTKEKSKEKLVKEDASKAKEKDKEKEKEKDRRSAKDEEERNKKKKQTERSRSRDKEREKERAKKTRK